VEFKFRIRVGIRTAKSDGDGSLSRHGPRNGCWGVLLIGKFTFPFPAGATAGADEIKKLGTTEHLAIAQYHDAIRGTYHAVPRL
jgi:hypothetical protein